MPRTLIPLRLFPSYATGARSPSSPPPDHHVYTRAKQHFQRFTGRALWVQKNDPLFVRNCCWLFWVMLLCGWISSTLLTALPFCETILRLAGTAYILWLAFETLPASYAFQEDDRALMGFARGLLLQLLNPKVIVYGLTLYSTFLAVTADSWIDMILSALFLAVVAFAATSTWVLFGAVIRTSLHQPRVRRGVNLVLSLLLVYTAIELSGLIAYVQGVLARS